jgi:hypothetical protein
LHSESIARCKHHMQASSASFVDLYLEFDDSGQISTKNYDKRDDFNFNIINFPNMCSRYVKLKALVSWIFLSFTAFEETPTHEYKNKSARRGAHFVPIGMPTTCWNSIPPKETSQISTKIYDKRDFKKFIFRYQDLVAIYSVSAEKIINDGFS